MLKRGDEELSVMEAVNNLSSMSEIDLKAFEGLDLELDKTDQHDFRDPRNALLHEGEICETFRVIHRYLQNMVRGGQSSLQDPQVMKGIQAIMLLSKEAAEKMDKFSGLYPKHSKPVSKLKEYMDLQKYYRQQILKQMPSAPEEPEEWEEELEEELKGLEEEKKGLKNLESVRKDEKYELFFIKNENKEPYFNHNLLRHIRLVGNFDELVSSAEGEDPLLKLRELLDRELYESAKEVLHLAAAYIDDFYKEAMKEKKHPFIGNLNKAIMALRMAANPKNLIENQSFKSCLEYYGDFHRFLRLAMKAPGYIDRISSESTDVFSQLLLRLTHALCLFFFMRIEPRKEALKLVHEMDKRGNKMRSPRPKPQHDIKKLQFWTDLRELDENIRFLLKYYPNGPILRTLDLFREDEEYEGFDPLTHHNFPAQFFTFMASSAHVTVTRLPCPIQQEFINKAHLVEEFEGFIRFYAHELKPDKHLMVNVQDRSTWEEFARCKEIEDAASRAELHNALFILGLAPDGEFYNQTGPYQLIGGTPVFMEQFKEQILSKESCGFYWSKLALKKEVEDFIDPCFKVIETFFFHKKTHLSIEERQAFIDIFYLLLSLKACDYLECDSMSFVCKDGLDTSAAFSGMLYGFIRLLSEEKPLSSEERDLLLWILYSPALLVRDRALHKHWANRAFYTLEVIHLACLEDAKQLLKEVSALFTHLKFPLEIDVPKARADNTN